MAQLDDQIDTALRSLTEVGAEPFNMRAYIAAFEESAQHKAADVLERLQSSPFAGHRPVFVSIGGGDGAELEYLLRNSDAHVGILVEAIRPLADKARERGAALTGGRRITVIEGDAQETVREAMEEAYRAVQQGQASYFVVTCHAVLHELYDRSQGQFDPDSFFARIFGDPLTPTWFPTANLVFLKSGPPLCGSERSVRRNRCCDWHKQLPSDIQTSLNWIQNHRSSEIMFA